MKTWRRCAPPFFRYPRKTWGGGVQTPPPPSRARVKNTERHRGARGEGQGIPTRSGTVYEKCRWLAVRRRRGGRSTSDSLARVVRMDTAVQGTRRSRMATGAVGSDSSLKTLIASRRATSCSILGLFKEMRDSEICSCFFFIPVTILAAKFISLWNLLSWNFGASNIENSDRNECVLVLKWEWYGARPNTPSDRRRDWHTAGALFAVTRSLNYIRFNPLRHPMFSEKRAPLSSDSGALIFRPKHAFWEGSSFVVWFRRSCTYIGPNILSENRVPLPSD